MADDAVSALVLATQSPCSDCPCDGNADVGNPITQRNVAALTKRFKQ